MPILLADVALWQKGLTLAAVQAAGVKILNLKVSHGLSTKHVAADVKTWAVEGRKAGMGLCTFHWLDSSASGGEQAKYAYARMGELGTRAGMAHVVDCEDTTAPATQAQYRDYVRMMTELLHRKIATYTGDWWWQPRGWQAAEISPWLHAAPNAGYLGKYPGDGSSHWAAGYGGWTTLSVMQYTDQVTIGGVKVSMSAIRDADTWSQMSGTADHGTG